MLIYKATLPNGKSYIGQTKNSFNYRQNSHKHDALVKKDKYYFHKAIRKYGWENIKWEILEDDINDIDTLNNREQYFIEYYNTFMSNGYNMTLGGEGTQGKILSEEHKEKIRNKMVGRIFSNDTKVKMKEAQLGEKHWNFGNVTSESVKLKIKNSVGRGSNFGKKLSIETKNKLRLANLGKKYSDDVNKKKGLGGEKNPFYGKKHSPESIRKMKESRKRNKLLKKVS